MSDIIARYLDKDGKIEQLPAKRAPRHEVLLYLAGKFDADTIYREKEVNAIITDWHVFSDFFILRREMVDAHLLGRKNDGSAYWVIKNSNTD